MTFLHLVAIALSAATYLLLYLILMMLALISLIYAQIGKMMDALAEVLDDCLNTQWSAMSSSYSVIFGGGESESESEDEA